MMRALSWRMNPLARLLPALLVTCLAGAVPAAAQDAAGPPSPPEGPVPVAQAPPVPAAPAEPAPGAPAEAPPPPDLFGRTVERVEIAGNAQIEATTVRGTLTTRVGEPLEAAKVRADVEAVFALGFFDDVVAEAEPVGPDGAILTIRVTELPVVNTITFHGNKKVLDETLKETVTGLYEGGFLSARQLIKVRKAVLDKYAEEGFRRATVVPVQDVTVVGGQRRADLTFVIREGEKTKIREIRFDGNEHFSDRALRGKLKTKERFWLTSWVTDSGIYRAADVSEDLLRLDDTYQNVGYYDVEVSEPTLDLSPDKRWLNLTYPIREGRRYRFGHIAYAHHDKVPDATLTTDLKVREGDTYDRSEIRADVATLTDRLGEHGYAFAHVSPDLVPDPDAGLVDVTFHVDEGKQVRIRRINITGNTKTRDNVIRREVRQQEGEIINTSLLRRSFQRINNLNYFETVDIVPVEAGPGLLDLDVRVKEKSTGQFSVGGGYSSVDGLVGLVEVTQGNLFGRGQTLSGRFERSGRRTVYSLSFKEPHLLDSAYSGGVDLFKTVRDFVSYEERRTGGGLTLGKAIGEYLHASMSYTYETVDIRVTDPSVPAIIQSQEGTSSTSSMALSLSRDTRDNYFDPRRGTRNVFRLEVAGGALQGDNQFVKGTVDSVLYVPVFTNSALSFRNLFGLAAGYGHLDVPPGERFFVGGISTVRGFPFGEAGPLASNGDPIGGDKEWVMSTEYTFPLVKAANLKGAFFLDWGTGFDTGQSVDIHDMNLAWGYEVRWISPLGPLRFGWGYVINDKRDPVFRKRGEQIFTIGTFF
jgi:outer membrane protein insertion porin family